MTRPSSQRLTRKEPRDFTAKTKLEVAPRFMVCAICGGGPLSTLGIEWDHINPWALSKDRSAGNCQPICKNCHRKKTDGLPHTSYGSDKHSCAKDKRLRGVTKQGPKKAIPKHHNPWPPKGSQKFQTRKDIRT